MHAQPEEQLAGGVTQWWLESQSSSTTHACPAPQSKQLGTLAQEVAGTHPPQQLPTTLGTCPGAQLGGTMSQMAPAGSHCLARVHWPAMQRACWMPSDEQRSAKQGGDSHGGAGVPFGTALQ